MDIIVIQKVEKILLQLAKDLQETEKFFDEINDSPLLSQKQEEVVLIVSNSKNEEKLKKLIYMTIALICCYWLGTESAIKEEVSENSSFYKKIYRDQVYRQWHNENMLIVGDIRNCIAHHGGSIKSFENYHRSQKRYNRTIPSKYSYSDPNDQYPTLKLKERDMRDFFRIAENTLSEINLKLLDELPINKG